MYFNGISYSLDYLSWTGGRRPSRGPTFSPIRLIHKILTIWKSRTHQLTTSWSAGVSPEAFVLRVLVRGSVERVGGVGVGLEVDDDFLTCKHSYHYFPSQFDSSKWGILTLEQKTFESTAGG